MRITRVLLTLAWVASMAGAGIGSVIGFLMIASASGAPQEAAGAAIGCLIAITPYIVARSLTELFRD